MAGAVSEAAIPKTTGNARLAGIDLFRFIAFVAVLVIHTVPQTAGLIEANSLAWHAARFAVPFYFIVSGYFFCRFSGTAFEGIKKVVFRIMPVYFIWLLIYTVFFPESWGWLTQAYRVAEYLISGGPVGYHLWFLPTLACGLVVYLVLRRYGFKVMFAVAVVLFALGLIFGPYREMLGLPHIRFKGFHWYTRNGPFFSFFFVVAGAYIATLKFRITLQAAAALTALGLGLQILESYLLWRFADGAFLSTDFTVGTALFGLGIFFLALNWPGHLTHPWLLHMGRLNLWMYCIHMAFVQILRLWFDVNVPAQMAMVFVGALSLTIASAYLAERARVIPRSMIY
ncbi:acyltransferase family protein [Asticcacaulis machinosus]|uniref:Acyltransferase n=1 Tax=Asticcacaulis machinosus TaxID=2984211 RepID=A0ABT5HKA9_9CAUL|nr:acyltransferase [Asticcacaulis machinosus]MDC7676685.1 acyltransferase [Asticcacaulis machinosus]